MTEEQLEERLQILETKVAYHEVASTEMNKTIYDQERRIAGLELYIKTMGKQLRELGISGDNSPDQKPPHY